MIPTRRLLGLLIAALISATVLTLPSGAHAATASAGTLAAKADPVHDFAKMPRKCVDPKLLIPQTPTKCNLNGFKEGRPTIVLWGDSHAWQMIPALRNAARNRNVNLVAFVMGSCPAMDPALTPEERHGGAPACLISNDRALRYVAGLKAHKKRVHVLIGTYWQRYLHAIRIGDTTSYYGEMASYWKTAGPRLFHTLGRLKVGVDVDGQVVTVPQGVRDCFTNKYYAYSCDLPRKKALRGEKSTKTWVKHQMRALSGHPRYVDVNRMCNASTCFARPQGVYTFWDTQHISASMSRHLSYVLDQTVTRAGGSGKPNGGGPVLGDDDDNGGGGGCGIPILCP
jgi:SGNH domain (fused to AT3 domains)